MPVSAGALRSLRHRNFRLFFTGQLVSLVGTWMQAIALSWLVYRLTGRASLLGLVVFATQFPIFLLGSFGGVVADRLEPRRLLLWTQSLQMAQAFVLGGLTLAGRVQVWHILVLAVALGITNAVDIPCRQVLVARTVEREDLPNAIALNSAIFHGSRVFGPSLAGLLVAAVGEGWCFMANGLSFLGALVGLACMRLPAWNPPQRHPEVLAHLKEGFSYAYGHREVRLLLLLLGMVCLLGMPYTALLPLFADGILHGGPRTLGLLMAASGVGAVLGSTALAGRKDPSGLHRAAAWGAGGAGAALMAFAASRSLPLSAGLILPLGFAMVTHMTANNTLVQLLIPDHFRGRVMALHAMVFTAGMPVGAVLAGMAAQRVGAPLTTAAGGLGCLAGAILFAWRYPSSRA